MSFDYFYGQQSDLFTFYRVPKVLFTNERFWNISADAKMLYGILLDRMSLSAKNGWIDKNGRVYIIFTIDEAKMALNCAEQKAIKLLSELEKKAGLIERKRQGLGKPNLIYVKNFISAVDSQLLNCENHNSGTMEITTQELPKSQCNNTDIKNTEFSDTDSIFPSGNGGMMDENDRYQEYFDYFSDQLSIDLLKKDYPYDSEMLDNILELIVETVCTKRPLIRIGAEERPAEIVRSRFMKLNVEHIRYVMDCFKENTTKIRNIRQYMLTTIYNAPTTIDTYYDALVRHDMSHGYLEGGFNCNLRRLDFQQESGLMSSLPLAQNLIEIRRGLTTSSTAIFVPFTTQELFQNGEETLYYGLNALSNNLIMVDRKKLKNPNGLILGTPGSGKSFSAKREITNAFLVTDDDIIICDPEAEYAALVHKFNGQVVKISSSSTNYINPMDINLNYSEDDNPVALKADFILSLCELIMGSKDGLQPIEKTVIDRCVHQIYQRYFDNPAPENMPILEDLYDALLKQDEKEAHHVATALEIYVKGSLKLFNNRTNVDIQNRLVCFDIKELGNQLKKIGMLIVQDQVWGRVTANRSAGKSTRYYIDEFHLLLKEEQTATYSVEIWKRFRKWGGLPTGITQNVKDLLRSPEIANILENSDFIYMLNQASDDRSILAQRLNISPHQLSYVTNSGEGEGLLFYGNVILPFIDRFPTDLELYRIMTTKLNEVAQEKEA